MPGTVLHLLSQRPTMTGSGVTLQALVELAREAGWDQHVVVGLPDGDPVPGVGGLPPERVLPLRFGVGGLPFAVPGMSDVMPYPSTRFSDLSPAQVEAYRTAWLDHLTSVLARVRPDVIHVHHVWLLAALVKDAAPRVPVITHCHGTGLRQMQLCPGLAESVRAGCARNDGFLALHRQQAAAIVRELGVLPGRVHVVGAGYREDLFHPRGRDEGGPPRLLYAGKLSAAKGLPALLDAFARVAARDPRVELHVAGSGAGEEGAAIAARLAAMGPRVVAHGALDPPTLAARMRGSTVAVLPSFFEGLPLVLVEARACGCRLVATALPGVVDAFGPAFGDDLETVEPPRLESVDRPLAADMPDFVDRLAAALARSLALPAVAPSTPALAPFTWRAVFRRVLAVWTGSRSVP